MQTKSLGNQQEKKKSVCMRYMKGICVYGKSCRYQHPPKENSKSTSDTKKPGVKNEVCSFYLQNRCKKGENCPYLHIKSKATKLEQRCDWLTFCQYYPTGQCKSKECRFLHVSKNDEDTFCATGKISAHLLEQAACKALLQDVSFNGNAPVCRDLLQGYCDGDSCPYLHLSRQAYSAAISGALLGEFESIFGKSESIFRTQETYHLESAGARHQFDSRLCNVFPQYGDQRYNPLTRKCDGNDPCKPSYENTFAWSDTRSDFDKQTYFASESDSVINGMQNLMIDDVNLIRNEGKQQIYDLREKLNRIAAEKARCHHGFSNRQSYEDLHRSAVSHISKEELKYQDMIRLLEKENMEMRRKLAELEGQKLNAVYKGRPGSSHQRENVDKGQGQGVEVEEHGHCCDTIGDEDDGWYTSNPDVASVPMAYRVSSYNPPRPKIQSKFNKKMTYQHNQSEKQQYHGTGQYSKTDHQKYQKFNQHRRKEVQDHKSVSKGIKNQMEKQGEATTSDQVKCVKPKMHKSISESFNTSKNCDLKKSRKGKMSEAPKKMHESKFNIENDEEIKTKAETNEKNITEREVVDESSQKDEIEKDKLDEDPGIVKDREEIENKEATLQDKLNQENDTKEECMEKMKSENSERKVENESSQKDVTEKDKMDEDPGIVKVEEEKENKEITYLETTPQDRLSQENDTKEKSMEKKKNENSEREAENESSQKDERERNIMTREDAESVDPKEILKSQLDKDESNPQVETVDQSVEGNLSGKVDVNESLKDNETEENKQAIYEENFVQDIDAKHESENVDGDLGNVKDGAEIEIKQTTGQEVLNQVTNTEEENMEKKKSENWADEPEEY